MTVHVSYLFSRNKKIGSRLISWASGLILKDMKKSGRVPSHVCVKLEFDNLRDALVVESVLEAGVRLAPYACWRKINEELYCVPCVQKPREQEEVFMHINELWNKSYDWWGILYFAWRFALHLLFKKDFPENNALESQNKFFCTELAARIAGYDRYSMVTPAKMCWDFLKLVDNKEIKEEIDRA